MFTREYMLFLLLGKEDHIETIVLPQHSRFEGSQGLSCSCLKEQQGDGGGVSQTLNGQMGFGQAPPSKRPGLSP